MTDEQHQQGRGRYVAVVCRRCGGRFRARVWKQGLACPNCRAEETEPLQAPGGAVDYMLADRSHGTTAPDVALAQWAKWCGYITANQYDVAMHRQNSELQSGRPARPIHEVLISLGFLDEAKANGLLRFLAVQRPDPDDEDFVARLLRRGDADQQKVELVRQLQKERATERNEVPPIGQLLVEERVIGEGQMLELLREQARDGVGSLKMALDMSQPPAREAVVRGLVRRLKPSRLVIRNAVVVVLLAVAVWGVWAWRLSSPRLAVYGRCTACGNVVEVPWSATQWPAFCPRCRRTGVRFAVRCPNGHVFVRESPFSHESCPQCGADFGRLLTKEDVAELSRGPR